jgi:hypothetical protein
MSSSSIIWALIHGTFYFLFLFVAGLSFAIRGAKTFGNEDLLVYLLSQISFDI